MLDQTFFENDERSTYTLIEPVGMSILELLEWYESLSRRSRLRYIRRIRDLQDTLYVQAVNGAMLDLSKGV